MGLLIAIDGGCKWQGSPDCLGAGVAVICDNDYWVSRCRFEANNSSSQRGEIMGLLCALAYTEEAPTDFITIVTDSEYLLKTITLEWLWKWAAQGWRGSTGDIVKNVDLWQEALQYFERNPGLKDKLNFQYIKGHILKYTPTMFDKAYKDGGINTVAENIYALATRPVSREQTLAFVTQEITSRGHSLFDDDTYKTNIVVANTLADATVTNVVSLVVQSL